MFGFEKPVAYSNKDTVATLGGESGPTLQEFLAGMLAVQPTVASICLSNFHLAGGE